MCLFINIVLEELPVLFCRLTDYFVMLFVVRLLSLWTLQIVWCLKINKVMKINNKISPSVQAKIKRPGQLGLISKATLNL